MELQLIWFILIAVLFTGYFFLEGFDFGVGISMPFLAEDDTDRRVMLNTIGPFWDANEVWLITAAGAMFAAFPHWYATLFSTYYLPLFVILVALIVRAVGFEFRSKVDSPAAVKACDAGVIFGSFAPSFLWGLILTSLVMGVPLDETKNFVGTIGDLITPYSILGGVIAVAVFTLHGAHFLTLRTRGALRKRAHRLARWLWWPTLLLVLVFALMGQSQTVLFEDAGLVPGTLPVMAFIVYVAAGVFTHLRREGWAFASMGMTIVLATVVAFDGLFPRVMPSINDAALDLTVYNASSSDLTLTVMLVVAAVFVPVVLLYQGWSYWVFRQRVTREAVTGGGEK